MNKATFHLSTGQYSYIEVELTGTNEDIIRKWFDLVAQYEARYQETLKNKKDDF